MEIAIRPFDGEDLGHLGERHGPDLAGPRRRLTLIAESGGEVVGAATTLGSTRHPDVVDLRVDVAPDHRRRGVGTGLVEALRGTSGPTLMALVDPTDPAALFLDRTGFHLAAASTTRRVTVATALRQLPALHRPVPGVAVLPVDDIADVAELYDRIYGIGHRWTGRYTPPPDAPWIAYAGAPVDGTIRLITLEGEPVGVTSLHNGSFDGDADAFLAPTALLAPADRADRHDRIAILARSVSATLTAGAEAGILDVNAENDTPANDDLGAVLDTLTTTPVSSLQAWLLDR